VKIEGQKMTDIKFYIDELKSDKCQCGAPKLSMQSFCRRCFKSLPAQMRRDLYLVVGGGYQEAYDAALHYLNS